jgi:MFS transporter, MHS family, proline/betaine transporter
MVAMIKPHITDATPRAGETISRPGPSAILVAAAAVAVEGYDLSIYALSTLAIARVFFPAGDPTSSLLLAVGSLGVGYVMRPIGGVILGAYADRAGRKAAIALTVVMMSTSTGLIGVIPSSAAIGIAAPLLAVTARLIQGFSAGGATGGSIAYLVEAAPRGQRGFYASWQQASQIGAFLLAATGATITNVVSQGESDWTWRIPFLLALIFGPIGLYIKSRLPDPEVFTRAKAERPAGPSVGQAVISNGRSILLGFGLTCLWNISAFILLFYMPTFAQKQLQLGAGDAFLASAMSGILLFVLCPMVGALSDRVGRRAPMFVGSIGLLILIYPLFRCLDESRTLHGLIATQCILAVLIACYTAPISAMLAELFPVRSRSVSLSVAYNLSTLIVGAFGPLIVTWLISLTGSGLALAFYVAGGATLSTISLLIVRDRAFDPLDT